mmetsp:Transcript_43242/g.68418  ORF Transcript_43242/g.68418 Transcript_43242/m.68418 type:complete len:243 (+) Transcript_43242:50-778(+)
MSFPLRSIRFGRSLAGTILRHSNAELSPNYYVALQAYSTTRSSSTSSSSSSRATQNGLPKTNPRILGWHRGDRGHVVVSEPPLSRQIGSSSMTRCAVPTLSDQGKFRLFSPASLLDGPVSRERLRSIARFRIWKEDGHLCAKASNMNFSIALPVFVSDGRCYPSQSAVLSLWQASSSGMARWNYFRRYLMVAARKARAPLGKRGSEDLAMDKKVVLKFGNQQLDMRWELPPNDKCWVFAVYR